MTERERSGIPCAHGLALRLSILAALAALVLLYCVGCVSSTPDRGDTLERMDIVSTAVAATLTGVAVATPTPHWVHIDGTVEDGEILPDINVWKTYFDKGNPNKRGPWLCRLPHGTRVQMVRRVETSFEDAIEIITPSGEKGWVTYWFIEELKYPLPTPLW